MRKSLAIGILSMMTACGLLIACGDDDSASPTTGSDASAEASGGDSSTDAGSGDTGSEASALGAVDVTVNYAGSADGGACLIGLFTAPTAPPLATHTEPNATFPCKHTFTDVLPGSIAVLAYLDRGNDSPMGPGPGDPVSQPAPITVTAGMTTTVTVELQEQPTDAGTD